MVPLDGNGCPGCKIVCMGGLSIGFGQTDGVWSCLSWQTDGWMGQNWHKGTEMDGDRNKRAPGPVR